MVLFLFLGHSRSPAGAVSLGPRLWRLHQQLGRVGRRGQGGAEQEVLVLGQVLRGGLLGCPCAVEQLPLQQGEVRLARKTTTTKV